MSVIVINRPPCSVVASIAPRRKRVEFCTRMEVRAVTHKYPSDYFYTRSEMDRFRKEAREERDSERKRMEPAVSPVQRAFNFASSSVVLVIVLIIGVIAATIACLPILLLLKITSVAFSCASREDIDSSIRPCSLSSDPETSTFTERLMLSVLGQSSLSCTNSSTTSYEEHCITPMLSM